MNSSNQSGSEAPRQEEPGGHTFRRAAGTLGGIILLSIVGLAAYALWILPSRLGATSPITQNGLVSQALTSIAGVVRLPTTTTIPVPSQQPVAAQPVPSTAQATVLPTVAATPLPTETHLAPPATATPVPASSTSDLAAATAEAVSTQPALIEVTLVPNSTALPGTGIGDQHSPTDLVVAGLALIGVILLARRLRIGGARHE